MPDNQAYQPTYSEIREYLDGFSDGYDTATRILTEWVAEHFGTEAAARAVAFLKGRSGDETD